MTAAQPTTEDVVAVPRVVPTFDEVAGFPLPHVETVEETQSAKVPIVLLVAINFELAAVIALLLVGRVLS